MMAFDAEARRTSDSLMLPTSLWMMAMRTSLVGDAAEFLIDRLDRPVHISFDDDVELLDFSFLNLVVQVSERDNTLAAEILFPPDQLPALA